MRKQYARWWILLGCWSCVAGTVWAQSAEPPCPLPASGCTEPDACDATYSSSARPPTTRFGQWWQYRAKPCLQYSHWGYPEEFEEIPFGLRVRTVQQTQIQRGWAARLWLYRYDFCDDGTALNPAGHRRLRELAAEFPVWSCHVLMIESTPDRPQLDAARRAYVRGLLEDSGVPAQVAIGVPAVSAPFGDETQWWYSRFERQVRSGGGAPGGASAAAGGGGAQPPAGP